MTLTETRQLGIEFERRVQTMVPEAEFVAKLDTDTVYSYLNQFQDKYITGIYKALEGIDSGTRVSSYTEAILNSMLTEQQWGVNATDIQDSYHERFILPQQFYMYVKSTMDVSKFFKLKDPTGSNGTVDIKLVSQDESSKYVLEPNNRLRIMRTPVAYISKYGNDATFNVIHDVHTTPTNVHLYYYRKPVHFDLMKSIPCELPSECFDDIVSGAVALYIQYATGAVANMRKQEQQQNNEQPEQQ